MNREKLASQKSKQPILSVKNLSVQYTNENGGIHSILNDISFDIGQQQSLGIIGESGSGKSITLLSLLGLMRTTPGITNGSINLIENHSSIELLNGINEYRQDLSSSNRKINNFHRWKDKLEKNYRGIRGKSISIIFQNPKLAFNPYFSIGQQICEMIRLHTQLKSEIEIKDRALYWLEKVGMDDPTRRFNNNPHGLSGGLCQRAMIAMALSSEPSILIADEPTTGLDTILQCKIIDLLQNLQLELSLSMLIVSHDLNVIRALCSDVLVYHSGMIVEQGPVNKVLLKSELKHPYSLKLVNCDTSESCFVESQFNRKTTKDSCPYYNSCDSILNDLIESCESKPPPLFNVSNTHDIRCWKYHE